MPDTPARIENLEDVQRWIAEHDGRINAWWFAQREWNDRHDTKCQDTRDKIGALNVRLTAIEKRIIYVAGVMSALGAAFGQFVLVRFVQ